MAELLGRHLIFTSYDDMIEPRPEKKPAHDPVDGQIMECDSCCRMGLTDERNLCKECYEEGY